MANAGRDQNRVTTLIGISSADISAAIPTPVAVDPVTNRLLVSTTGSNGTILDGVDTGIAATVKDLTNANPLTVAIVDGTGDQITSFGGGDLVADGYTDGDSKLGQLVFTHEAGSGASAIIHALRSDGGGNLLVSVQDTVASSGTILDGVDTGIAATVKDLTNSNPLTVAIVDSSGDQITSFGGGNQVVDGDINGDTEAGTLIFGREAGSGASAIIHALRTDGGGNLLVSVQDTVASSTEYTQADVVASPVGTVAMGHDGSNVRALNVDSSGNLQAEVTNTVTVDGSGVQQPIIGDVGLTGQPLIQVAPATSGGLSIFRSIDLDETEEEAKATAGQVYGWYIYNAASSVRYVKLYNATAASVTVGTTTPVMTIPIPATSGANVEFTNGIAFSTAITAAATTGVADSDTGAPGANEVIINLLYS